MERDRNQGGQLESKLYEIGNFYQLRFPSDFFLIENTVGTDLTHDYRPLERMQTFEQVVIENES